MNDARTNLLTIDVEDWRNGVHRKMSNDPMPPSSLVVEETELILDLLDEAGVLATFFVLADVAETYPRLIRHIDEAGHEIASHGLSHNRIYTQNPEEFRQETLQAKDLLESTIGKSVHGYRAAEFSITAESWWALDILAEAGFSYDSSVYPISGLRYGVPDSPLGPHVIRTDNGNSILEYPLTTLELWGGRWPVAGGGYFGLLPYSWTRSAIRAVNGQGRPSVVYVHPYEFSANKLQLEQPPKSISFFMKTSKYSLKHNFSRKRIPARFKQLLQDFTFTTMRDMVQDAPIGQGIFR